MDVQNRSSLHSKTQHGALLGDDYGAVRKFRNKSITCTYISSIQQTLAQSNIVASNQPRTAIIDPRSIRQGPFVNSIC
jgi:hypothetical protein